MAHGDNLPFADKQFSRVFSNFVIHYFSDEVRTFKEIARVLRENGYFVGTMNICEVQPGSENLYNTTMPVRLGQGEKGVIVTNLIKSEHGVRRALDAAGLVLTEYHELYHPSARIDDSYPHRQQVTKKAILFVATRAVME